ncbi:MAG: hypothetical protein ACK4YO_01060 [Candidatus Altarchaeaceae archaeon]
MKRNISNIHHVLKSEFNSPSTFKKREREYVKSLQEIIKKESGIIFDIEELCELLLSACRANDFGIIKFQGNRAFLDEDRVLKWVNEKLIPNTVIVSIDDEDLIRLLIFCIEITYQMFAGGTKATVTQKGFRERRRTFESILVDQFIGKLGEVMVKKFLEKNFPTKIELDWDISRQIEKYRNDIINAKKKVSIKTSPSLAGIWAEADIGYDYGITVKCFIPQSPILQFFIEVCGFSKLLDFADTKIPSSDERFRNYLQEIRNRIKDYKCGEIQTRLKGFICGYFKTSEYKPIQEGRSLPYLGKIRESRYLVPINDLKYTNEDWKIFLKEADLL